MQVLEDSDMIQLNNAAQYNAWKGQLYIHEQLVCDISFQTSSIFSIPAQLPEKLDVREVIRVSELRKKLPEDIFQKTDFTGQEVFCGNIYYSLFPVVPTNIVGSEFDKVLKYLKDEDLALIKVLNDQGFLILVNSAILPNRTGVFDRNSVQLNALFLFPHQKFLHQKDREEWENKFIRKELPLAVSNLLPGLHYAIIEANKLQKDKALYPAPLVEQYFRKYAVLPGKKDSSSERKSEQSAPLSALHSPVDDLPQKCSPLAFSCLKLYISSPLQFSVSVIKMNNILAENAFISSNADQFGKTAGSLIKQDNRSSPSKTAESKAGSGRRKGKRGVHENKEQHSKKTTKRRSVKRREKKSKKKSVKQAALTTAETGENQTSNKRRRLLSEGKKPIASSSEATVKLAHVPYPQRRKRGAEVLSAAFIQDEKIQTTEKITPSKANEKKNLAPQTKAMKRKPQKAFSPEQHIVLPDRRSKRKMSDPGKIIMAVEAINKSESLKKASERRRGKRGRTNTRTQQKMKAITVEQINTSGKSSESLKDAQKWPSPPIPEDSILDKRISMYESHALNLLADLALNSFGSSNTPYLNVNVASAPELLVEEGAPRDDHVSTVEPPGKAYSPPAPSTTPCPEPEHTLESDKPKNGFNVSPRSIASQKRFETGEKQISQKAHIAAAKAKARYNATSKICLEHSYSQLPLGIIPGKSTKEANEKPIQGVPDSTTSADVVPESADGLSEKVVLSGGSESLVTGSKQRGVFKLRDNVLITIHWEPSYDFDLDSKFTSDPLEKTINRALHGPWNPHLKEKVEDVKIILHMWIALFYSKSKKQIHCNSRKVVEHSNPAKYVSINTVLDPFEFYEIMETDNAASTLNTNVILPMGKKSEALRLENLAKAGKSESVSLQDLTLPSIPTKDYNIKLASEFFQMCKDSERAFYSDSLQTSMTCQMAPTSKGAQISASSVPTVCYIGDPNLFNTELTDKSENYMDIGGFPSEKAKSKETEHEYVRNFFAMNEAEKLIGSQTNFSKIVRSNVNDNEGHVKACESALKCNDEEASEMIHVGAKNISSSESVDAKANSKLIQSEEHFRQVVDSTENIASRPRLPLEGLASYNISKPVDYASDCTEGSKTRSSWDCVGFEDAQEKAMEDIPDESENLVEPKYTHKLDEDDLNEVEKTENEAATEKSFLSLNIAQSRLFGYSADFSNVAATDEGIKESEASNHDMNQNLVESLSASSTKEDSSTHEKAEALHDEACLVHEPSSATASSFELDTNAIIYTLGNLDIKDSSESTMECEEHVHKDMLAESHNRLLISQTQFDVEKIQNSSCLEGTVNEKVDLSGSAVKEMEIDALSTKTESPACQNVVIECVSLGTSRDMLEGESDVSDSNETALHLNITSSFSDQLMRRYSEMDSLQPSVGKQQLDPTGDASPTVKPIRSAKGSTHINRSSSSNKKEFLSKLKRICLGSIAGHQVSSNFENVLSGDESSINGFTSDKNEVMDEAKIVLPLEEDINILKNLDDVVEKTGMENCNVEPEKLAMEQCNVDVKEPAVENCSVEAEEPAVDTCSVEAEEPAVDTCSVEAEEPAVDYCSVEAEEPAVDYCSVEAEEPAVDYCSVEAEEPAVGYCSVEAEEPAVDNCILEAEEFTMDNLSVVAEETIMENCDVISEEPIIDSSSEELINENFVEPELLEEAMPPQDNRLISPSFENVSDSIEQDASPKLPDICFIVNTGSISKEQYDRWSETSDDDIEYIRSYTEPLSHQKDFQEDIPEPPRSLPEEVKPLQELTPANRAKKSFRKHSGSNSGLYEAEENMSLHLKDLEYNSKTNHGNLTVTRNIKDPECATRTIRKEISRSDFDHVFSGNRTVSDDLTQNTLDMENVRFTCNLKEILRKSSKEKYTHGPRSQTMFEARRIPSCSPSTIKCINPLLITLRCPYRRTDFRRPDSRHSSTYNTSPYYEDELWDEPVTYSRTIRKVRTQRYSPFHFSRLRYETPLDKSNSDISAILNECVQSNHLKLSSVGLGNAAVDRTSGSQLAEEGGQQARTSVPVSSKSQSFKNIISDLCTSLHSRLQNVARETEQKMSFYIYETDDADFISSAKSLLVKDGHVPIDPWDFLNNERCESHQLLVIIKNEDVVSCINKIPYLMQLKLLHNVTFAGVDTPEDLAESAYEELFQAGGFVVSDKSVLESITLGKLKEVIAILEKMSRTSPWKWLIHYRENRKLKEDKRTEDLSQAKMALLKSYQQCNIIEILPYHQCDSRSKEPSDDLACLQNLQYQHSHSRLAVYLTGTTSTLSAECEQNGILVYDVDTFLRTIQKVDSQLQTSNRS